MDLGENMKKELSKFGLNSHVLSQNSLEFLRKEVKIIFGSKVSGSF